jgi:hypothetical protein
MAVTINASTTTGLVQSADTSGIIQLQSNGTTAVTIDTNQRAAFVAGTAALPAITTTGDTNTGIFFPAADTIAFAEGGAEVARFDSSGNLGIGTSSPAYALDVRSTTAPAIRLSRSGTAGQIASIVFEDGNATLGSGSTTRVASDAGAMSFSTGGTSGAVTGGTERMRIDSSGNLLVGTTTAQAPITAVSASSSAVLSLDRTSNIDANLRDMVQFRRSVTSVGTISCSNTATAYNTSSDYRLKENIAPMTGALAKVSALKPVTYNWKLDGSVSEGFIAHELQAIVPDCVSGEKDAVDEDGNPKYQGIDTSFLVATLTAAIQELNAKVEAQAVRIAELEGAK